MDIKDLPDKTLLRPDEVAKFFRVTRQTVYNWCAEGRFEYIKIGHGLRIYRGSIMRYIKAENSFKIS